MSGSRGSSGQRSVRRGSAIASASTRMRLAQGEAAAAEVQRQRIAPIFGHTGRRAIQEGQSAAIVEMMVGQQSTSTNISSQTTTVTSTPVTSRRLPVLAGTSTPAASSEPTMDISSLMISPASVAEEIEGMVGPFDHDCFGDEPEAGDVGREEVVGGSEEDFFGHEHSDLDYDDYDPVSDPPYVPSRFSPEGSEEEEEVVVVVQPCSSMPDRRDRQEEPQPAVLSAITTPTIPTNTTTSTTSQPQTSGRQQQQAPPSSRKGQFTSPIWNHFTVSSLDETFAVCKHCKETKSRGKNPARLGTSCLQAHLKRHHRPLFEEFLKMRDGARGDHPSTERSRPAAATAGARPRTAPSSATSRALPSPTTQLQGSQSSVASSAPSTAPSSASQAAGKRQSLLTFAGVTKPLPPGHCRIRRLNGLLARAMCSQLLPYSLVQPGSDMRDLLQFAAPEWPIPSRHFFSCTAIPALHQSVVNNVARSLDHAVGERVHITMDSWTSRFGTDRYLSFTAHWVSLVEVGEGSAAVLSSTAAAAHWVVPPRGIRGEAAVSCDPLPSSGTSPKRPRLHNSSVKPRLCQALLEMRGMGSDKLTANVVLQALRDQERRWLSNRGLRVGLVVSDNGANLLAAIRKGNLDHIPCLAHVLNLVVQRFLRTYQGMGELLEVARNTVRHFRRSPAASARLAELQQAEGLPRHRMFLDVPVRWNSTLAMLERLLKQRRAVNRYIADLQCSGSSALQVITNAQWGLMQQVSLVLAPFLQGTEEVSREQTSLCEWVPLVCLLDRAVFDLLEQGEAALGQLDHQQALSEGEEEEEEEEEVEVPDLTADEGEECSAAELERGWNRREEAQQVEEEDRHVVAGHLDSDVAAVANLFPMAAHMLRCLRRDPRVINMRKREDIWITLMLDPRLKGKLGQFMQGGDQERHTRALQQALVRKLEEAFPQPCSPPVPVQPTQQPAHPLSSSSRRPGDLRSLKRQLYQVELPREEVHGAAATSSTTQQQRFTRMVADYMGSFSGLDTEAPVDPMEYWVKMLGIWRELAQYALELLSSPPSSVLSERSFSAAGGVVTEKRSRLSTKSVDRLTFIKLNQAWVGDDFMAPAVGERRRK